MTLNKKIPYKTRCTCLPKTLFLRFSGGKSGWKGDGEEVGESSWFLAAVPLPHRGTAKASRAQPTRKTIGYSYAPAEGSRGAPALRQRCQVSPEADCMGTNDLKHPTFQKISGDTPQKAPIEGGGEPSPPAKPELLERNAFSRYPTPTSHPSRSGLPGSDLGFP